MTDAREQRFPVSYAQERLWFLEQLAAGSALWAVPVSLRLSSPVDVAALTYSVREIVRRHEVLRTTFEVEGGVPVQVVHPDLVPDVRVVDLTGVPPDAREGAMRERAAAQARLPFDLARGPLVRPTLFRLAPDDHLLLVVLHHMVVDGWSLGLLFTELTAIYSAAVQGRPSPLPELPIQYADYAVWQRRRLAGEALHEELAFWRERLADLPALRLPIERSSPADVGTSGRVALTVPRDVAATLGAVGRSEGATLFMTLLAGFQALLHRYSGQDDIAVGTVVANRTRTEIEALIGCFVNTVVLRGPVRAGDTFRDLVRRARETTLEAYAHQEVPFERLVEELRPARDAGRTPLVQVLLTLQNTPPVARHASDTVRDGWELDRGSAGFDLTVDLWDTPAGLESRWEYRADLYDGRDIGRLARGFGHLLGELAEAPDRPVELHALMDDDERREVLDHGRGPAVAVPEEQVHRLIRGAASRRPTAIAVEDDEGAITYAGLVARSDRLAAELARRGVRPGETVGILLHRSAAFGVAMLGVLSAGAAFLAVDPADPAGRRTTVLDDAGVRVVVSDSLLASGAGDREVVCVDLIGAADPAGADRAHEGTADRHPAAEAAAYTVYTSGSTGLPKGVRVPHRALTNHCHAVVQRYGLVPEDRVLQLAPVGFDVAIEEILPTWLAGGTVHVPLRQGALPFADLERCLKEHRVTVLNLPASYWHEWVDHLARTGGTVPEALRLVVVGSERVSTARLRVWQQLAGPGVRWLNAYGVTEATITATTYEPRGPVPADAPDVVPIGRPLANVTAHVLDAGGEPVPPGVAGELHLGGPGLALGYQGDDEFTAKCFVTARAGARLYRTGDLARWDRDGDLELLGRRDAQLKLRGYRVEPGEVEAALLGHPGVREAVVREVAGRLVAYLLPDVPPGPAAADLRGHLRTRLPAHMIPESFLALERLPRSPHGKIDRAALPDPAPPTDSEERVAPRTPLEARLARLWAAVLDVPAVGVTEDFFESGGHSLLATRLLSRVQSDLGVEVPLRTLFEARTVAGLAAAIGSTAADGTHDTSPRSDGWAAEDLLPFDVGHLSDADVTTLLAELLAEGGEPA